MEKEQSPTIEGSAYSRVRAKIRNPALNNDSAWLEVHNKYLPSQVEGYPEKYLPYLSLIRTIFDLRREEFLTARVVRSRFPARGKVSRSEKSASEQINELVSKLSEQEQDLLGQPLSVIRDLFNIGFHPHKIGRKR